MQAKKLLLLSVSAGAGHMRAAEAIRAYASLQANTPNRSTEQAMHTLQVTHLDVMDYVTAGLRQVYTKFYMKLLNKAPSLWGYLYKYSNHAQTDSAMEKIRRKIERMNAKALLRAIQKEQADIIICTHFLPAELVSRLLLKIK